MDISDTFTAYQFNLTFESLQHIREVRDKEMDEELNRLKGG